uniref:Putative putzig n=1 Tax=Corethrella appendiculata TaxID=1370023 RepID=U5EPY9_9DIPT
MQINAVKKINSLLQSGAVSVTGPNTQTRVLKHKLVNPQQQTITQHKCFVCDENAGINCTLLTETTTTTSHTTLPNKIAKIVGEGFMVIVSGDDVICRRCITLFNQMDKLEADLERVRNSLTNYINKKYNILDDELSLSPPPVKMQKIQQKELLGGTTQTTYSIKTINQSDFNDSGGSASEVTTSVATIKPSFQLPQQRKIINSAGGISNTTNIILNNNNSVKDVESQLTNMFESSPTTQTTTNNGANIVTTIGGIGSSAVSEVGGTTIRRQPIKLYKCMSCDFKTTDLSAFTPHHETCKGTQQQLTSAASTVSTTVTGTPTSGSAYRCKVCKNIFATIALLKQHNLQEHQQSSPIIQTGENANTQIIHQQTGSTITQFYSCKICTYKTPEKSNYEDHLRKHIKLKPFKCRVCLARFETREQASVHAKTHQPDYFKCGMCAVTFNKRELLVKHLETHNTNSLATTTTQSTIKKATIKHDLPIVSAAGTTTATTDSSSPSTQKLLQETINEAIRDSIGDSLDPKNIQFHSCGICSVTFLNEQLYTQHMRMHKTDNLNATTGATTTTTSTQNVSSNKNKPQIISINNIPASSITQTTNISAVATTTAANSNDLGGKHQQISDGDLESIFEKMHSDKNDINTNDNLVITSQETTGGNITFNITIPQQQAHTEDRKPNVGIDMPTLDQGDENNEQLLQQEAHQTKTEPVSMPSLDDDGETQNSQQSNTEAVPMDLEELQNASDGQQIKFILNENGQLLQLDNHILTTDADGNQILVQGTDTEQIQQLLQSVGVVMQGGEGLGEGETLQMISGENNQMILVQGADGQEQLIDASMLNAEGTHITTEDGIQIPVSVAFTTAGNGEQQHLLQIQNDGEHGGEQTAILDDNGQVILQQTEQEQVQDGIQIQEDSSQHSQSQSGSEHAGTASGGTTTGATSGSGGEGDQVLFNFDELIQPQVVIKQNFNR